jgi:hypothetical protein
MNRVAEYINSYQPIRFIHVNVSPHKLSIYYYVGGPQSVNELLIMALDDVDDLITSIKREIDAYGDKFFIVIHANKLTEADNEIEFLSRLLCGIPSGVVRQFTSSQVEDVTIRCRDPDYLEKFSVGNGIKFVYSSRAKSAR